MKLTMLGKDSGSGGNGCPSVYLAEDGSLVVQGPRVDPATHQELQHVLPGEAAVHISADVVVAAAERYRARTTR